MLKNGKKPGIQKSGVKMLNKRLRKEKFPKKDFIENYLKISKSSFYLKQRNEFQFTLEEAYKIAKFCDMSIEEMFFEQ